MKFICGYLVSISEPHAFEPRIRKTAGSDPSQSLYCLYVHDGWCHASASGPWTLEFESLFLTLLAPSLMPLNQHTMLQVWTNCVTISELENYGLWDVTPVVL